MKKYHIWGAVFAALLGALMHYAYEFSGESAIVGLIAAVNESTWEHLKLLFFPVLIYNIFEFIRYGYIEKCFFNSKLKGILAGMLTIAVLFYTYQGILGFNVDIINIVTFVIGVAVTFYVSYIELKKPDCKSDTTAIIIIVIISMLFFVWTTNPPSLGIFTVPLSSSSGTLT